jgi:hypothetical protein
MLMLCLFGLSGIVHGAEVQKIGVIDLQKIIDKWKKDGADSQEERG